MADLDLPIHQEDLTSVAIDGARIGAFIAINLVSLDRRLDEGKRAALLTSLAIAGDALDQARENYPVIITSLHQVQAASAQGYGEPGDRR
jgi:hypothetical protein